MPKMQMIIFIGIQASGKSTFFKNLLACHGYRHINLDTLRTRHRESMAIKECFDDKVSFVVDNTNPERKDRERYIPDAVKHGYEVIGIFFQSIIKDCVARNENRENKIPAHAIAATQKKLQIPLYEEGFDKLFFAKMSESGFEITEWKS